MEKKLSPAPKIVGKHHSKAKMKKLKENIKTVMKLRKTDPR